MFGAALVASDFLVVPLQPEDYGRSRDRRGSRLDGTNRQRAQPQTSTSDYLITMVSPRQSIHQLYEARLRAVHGLDVFTARIPRAADFVEAVARRLPICRHKPKGASSKAIRALAEELLARIESQGFETEAA